MKHRRLLYATLGVGVLALAAGGGTFASFNAQTTNPGSTFATGSLLLSNQVGAGTVCFSYNGVSNANPNCSSVVSVSNAEPGTSLVTANVFIGNTGTINASTFDLQPPSSTDCTDTQVTSLGSLNPTTGSPLCHAVVMYVQEVGQGTVNAAGTYTPGTNNFNYCWFGDGSGSANCVTSPATLNALAANTDTLASFDASSPIELAPLTASGTKGTPAVNDLGAGGAREFTVGVYLPNTVAAQNQLQALKSTFGITWQINQ